MLMIKTIVNKSFQASMLAIVALFAAIMTDAQTQTPGANGKIAFTSDRDGNKEIYVMNENGTEQVRLTNNSVVDDHPTWSADGTKIAFVGEWPSGGFAVFVMDADGTNKVEITPINYSPAANYWSMSWSPDNQQIVFQEDPNLFVVNVVSRDRRFLTTGGATVGRIQDPVQHPI